MKQNSPAVQHGFTLVEMMIVTAILAILAVIALPSYERYIERGDATEAKAEILKVQSILTQERLRNPNSNTLTASGIRSINLCCSLNRICSVRMQRYRKRKSRKNMTGRR